MSDFARILGAAQTQPTAEWGQVLSDVSMRQWAFLLKCLFAGVIAGRLVQTILRGIAQRLIARGWRIRGMLFLDIAGPANLLLITVGLSVGLAPLPLSVSLRHYVALAVEFLYILCLAWVSYNLVDIVEGTLLRFTSRTASRLDDQVVPLIRKTLRVFVVVVFSLSIAENIFGAYITTWLAGLGIAGLAVSLAAQDSIKNLFGSVTILLDHPFNVGDIIAFAGRTGTVEEIGFRSTKLRTFDGHLVTMPNSKIVEDHVENITARPSIRRVLDVTITYDTPPEKIEQALRLIKGILCEPDIASAFDMEKLPPRVSFNEFNPASLNIRVFYWFHPNDYWGFLDHAERFNLKLVRAFDEAGIEFAFPTQTVYLGSDDKRPLGVRVLGEELGDGRAK